jgi:hypothetical protein
MPFILVWRDIDFWLVGPFASSEESVKWALWTWGDGKEPNLDCDPRWHTLALSPECAETVKDRTVPPFVNNTRNEKLPWPG